MKKNRFIYSFSAIFTAFTLTLAVPANSAAATLGEDLIIETNTKPSSEWDQIFGGMGSDRFDSVFQTSDGGYVVAGYTESSSGGEISDIDNGSGGLLVKFDSFGKKVWDQVYGGTGSESFTEVIQVADGGYVVVGGTSSSESGEISDINNGLTDGLLVKFDSFGNRVWDQVYGGSDYDRFSSVTQTSDGGYVVAGYTESSSSGEIWDINNGSSDGLLVKFDSLGNRVWDQVYGGNGSDGFSSVMQTSDGGYVVVGYTASSESGEITDTNNGSSDGLLVKFDSYGNWVWDQVFGGYEYEDFCDVIQTADGGYVACGETIFSNDGEITDINNGEADGLLVKFDDLGNIEWDQVFGGPNYDFFASVIQIKDGGYVVAGQTELLDIGRGEIIDIHNGVYDGLLAKFYTNGEWVWDESFGGTELDFFLDIAQTDDGGYAAVGHASSSNSGEILDINNGAGDGILVKFTHLSPPQIISQPTDQTVIEMQTVNFTVTASGTPMPTVQWQKSTDKGITWYDISGETSSTLSFTTSLNDSGNQYRAVFTNSVGSVISDVATLQVNKKTTSVVIVSANNLDWGIVSNGGEYIIGEIVKVTATANYGFSFIEWQENGSRVSTSSTYRFKVGTQDRNLVAIFQPSWPKDIKLTGTSLTANSVALSLSKPVVGSTKYAICYGENRIEKIASEGINWVIEGLEIAKSYKFTVQAIYSDGIETNNGPSVTIRMKR